MRRFVAVEHDLLQVQRVLDFRRNLSDKGVLFGVYKTIDAFKDFLNLHLAALANEYGTKWGPGAEPPEQALPASQVAPLAASDLDLSVTDSEHGFVDLVLEATQATDEVQRVLESMTNAAQQLGEGLAKRTAQLERAKGRDQRSLERIKYIADRAGEDMQSFVSEMEADIPVFASAYAAGINAYAKATLMLPDFTHHDVNRVIGSLETIRGLTTALRGSQTQAAQLRDSVATVPPVSSRLTQAKNKTVAMLRKLDEEWTRAIDISGSGAAAPQHGASRPEGLARQQCFLWCSFPVGACRPVLHGFR